MKLNPVLANELKLNARSVKMTATICVINILLAIVCMLGFLTVLNNASRIGSIEYSRMISLYTMVAYLELGLLLLFVPSITASCISGERERQTLEILLTTKMSPGQIIAGKLSATLWMALTLAVSTMPVISVIFMFGGVTLPDLAAFLVGIAVSTLFVGSIGIFFSSLVKKTTTATILSYTAVVGTILVTYAVVFGLYRIIELMQNSSQNLYQAPDVGAAIYLLLLNPVINFFGIISRQVGTGNEILYFCSQFGNYANDMIVKNWVITAIIVQCLVSAGLLKLSARIINPLKKR